MKIAFTMYKIITFLCGTILKISITYNTVYFFFSETPGTTDNSNQRPRNVNIFGDWDRYGWSSNVHLYLTTPTNSLILYRFPFAMHSSHSMTCRNIINSLCHSRRHTDHVWIFHEIKP